MANCRQCGKELATISSTGLCIDCARADLRKIFKENPELKQAFKEAVEETFSPENRKKMADNTVKFMQAIQANQKQK